MGAYQVIDGHQLYYVNIEECQHNNGYIKK